MKKMDISMYVIDVCVYIHTLHIYLYYTHFYLLGFLTGNPYKILYVAT